MVCRVCFCFLGGYGDDCSAVCRLFRHGESDWCGDQPADPMADYAAVLWNRRGVFAGDGLADTGRSTGRNPKPGNSPGLVDRPDPERFPIGGGIYPQPVYRDLAVLCLCAVRHFSAQQGAQSGDADRSGGAGVVFCPAGVLGRVGSARDPADGAGRGAGAMSAVTGGGQNLYGGLRGRVG